MGTVQAAPATGATRQARAGAAMAFATLAMAVASAIQAVAYLSSFGVSARTDAFFAAFALYTVFGIFTQSIRVSSVPLLVGRGRMPGRDYAATLAIIAVPVAIVCLALAGPLAGALAPGADAANRALAADAIRILGGAMVLQLGAAGAATLLGVWDRFDIVAGGYIAGAFVGLVSYFAVVGTAGELSLGWSMLAMAVATAAWMVAGLVRERSGSSGRVAGGARLTADAGKILGRTLVYFVINGLFLVTLALATKQSAGDATVLSYAYLFASYLVAFTGVAVGISRAPDLARGAAEDWSEVLADTAPHGYRYAMVVCAPAMAGLVAAGASLIGLILSSFSAGDVSTLRVFAALLCPWLCAALLVNFLLPALFALGRAWLVNLLAIPLVALHVGAALLGEALWGVNGIVLAMFVAPLVYGLVLLAVTGGHRRGEVLRKLAFDSLRFFALAAAAFGVAAGLGVALGGSGARPLVVALLGTILYLAGARVVAPREFEVMVGAARGALGNRG
jgi:peptidoglycan biosynthesis protein MviN/MurJ (putative lipid II flippase)